MSALSPDESSLLAQRDAEEQEGTENKAAKGRKARAALAKGKAKAKSKSKVTGPKKFGSPKAATKPATKAVAKKAATKAATKAAAKTAAKSKAATTAETSDQGEKKKRKNGKASPKATPKAKQSLAAKIAGQFKVEELPEATQPGTEEQYPDEGRDRVKARLFKAALNNNELPAHIAAMAEAIQKKTGDKRDGLTALINKLYVKNSEGNYVLNTSDPYFEQAKTTFSEETVRNLENAMPKFVLKGKYNLSDAAFQQALDEGEIIEVEGNHGRKLYSFEKIVRNNSSGKKTEGKLGSSKIELDQDGYAELDNAFNGLGFSFAPPAQPLENASGQHASGSSRDFAASSAAPLALHDRGHRNTLPSQSWSYYATYLNQAKNAYQGLAKDTLKAISQVGSNKEDHLYRLLNDTHNLVLGAQSELDHALVWKDFFWRTKFLAFCFYFFYLCNI